MNSSNAKLYKINLNVVGEEPKRIWIKSTSKTEAKEHINHNTHSRTTIQNIETGVTPKEGETVHIITNGEVKTVRY